MKTQNQSNFNEKNPRTIYFVWNYLEWGGVQIYFLGLMRSVSQKYQVKAVLPKGSDEKILTYLKNNNVEYDFFEGNIDFSSANTIVEKLSRRWNDFQTNLSLARFLSKYDLKNSIVQIDVAPWAGFLTLFYLTLKTNVFVTFHTALPQVSSLKKTLWKAKFSILEKFKRFHLAASNLDVKKSLRPFVDEKDYEEIEVVYSSVNLAEIEKVLNEPATKGEIAEKYKFPKDKLWICNVAQFIDRKGCWIFLEAIQILQKKRDDLFFLWLGTASINEETERRIEEYKVDENFRYLSPAEIGAGRSELLKIWQATDLFVLPSFQEGLPMSLVEAMALGKTCIASEINAIPEAIVNQQNGILVKAGDSSDLAKAIENLAENAALRKTLGIEAQKSAAENFDEKVTTAKMLKLYDETSI